MKIRFLANTNIRLNPKDLSIAPVGIIFLGTEIKVEDRLYKGLNFQGIDTYFKDKNGWYYWSGKVAIIYKELPAPNENPRLAKKTTGEAIAGSWQLPVSEKEEVENDNPIHEYAKHDVDKEKRPHLSEESTKKEKEVKIPPGNTQNSDPIFDTQASGSTQDPAHENKLKPHVPKDFTAGINAKHPLISPVLYALNIPDLWQRENVYGSHIKIAILDGKIDPELSDVKRRIVEAFVLGQPIKDENKKHRYDTATFRRVGLIAGTGEQLAIGICPKANIYTANIYNDAMQLNYLKLVASIEWAISIEVDIIFTSAEIRENALAPDQRKLLNNLSKTAHQKGILIIGPVGSGKSHQPENRYPACLPYNLAVGAIDDSNIKVPNTLRSTGLDLVAPSVGLYNDNNLSHYKASTEAAALVTGLISMLLEIARKHHPNTTACHIKDILRHSAIPKFPGTKCRDLDYGCGVINLPGALAKIATL